MKWRTTTEPTKPWFVEKKNAADVLIASVHYNSSKNCRRNWWKTQASCSMENVAVSNMKLGLRPSTFTHTRSVKPNFLQKRLKNHLIKAKHHKKSKTSRWTRCDMVLLLFSTVVKVETLAFGKPYACQQDSAPCHTAAKTQKWSSENFYDFTDPNVWLLTPLIAIL